MHRSLLLLLLAVLAARPLLPQQTAQELLQESLRLVEAKQPAKAVPLLERVLQADPSNAPAHALLGQIELDNGRPQQALAHLEAAVKAAPDDSATLFDLGVAQLQSGRAAQALATLQKVAAREPDELGTKAYLVKTALRLKRTDVALANLEALRRLPNAAREPLLHAQLVEWCFEEEAGTITAGEMDYALGLSLPAPQEARVRYLRAILDERRNDFPAAEDELRRAMRLDNSRPDYPSLLLHIQGREKIDNMDEGLLQNSLERFPGNRDLLIVQALRLASRGQISDALQIEKDLEGRYPKDAPVYVLLGRLRLNDLKFGPAAAALDQALRLDPKDATGHYYRGVCYRKQGDDQKAIEEFESSLARNPNYISARYEYGQALFDSGQYEKARRALAEVIRLAPGMPGAYNLMSQTERRLGNAAEAARNLARFKELSLASEHADEPMTRR